MPCGSRRRPQKTGPTNKPCQKLKDWEIFGTRGKNYPQVKPHVALMSPGPPKQLKSRLRPAWNTRDASLSGSSSRCPLADEELCAVIASADRMPVVRSFAL